MSNHCSVSVAVTPVGPFPANVLKTKVAAVPIDQDTLTLLQCTVGSDSTALVGGQVVRTIDINFSPAFKVMFPDGSNQAAPFYLYMRQAIATAVKTKAIPQTPILS